LGGARRIASPAIYRPNQVHEFRAAQRKVRESGSACVSLAIRRAKHRRIRFGSVVPNLIRAAGDGRRVASRDLREPDSSVRVAQRKRRVAFNYLRRVTLWHVSEDGSIPRFEPRANPEHDSPEALVWAIDSEHVPAYWFPRELPRGTFWAVESTTDEDVERFLTGDRSRRVHAIEAAWLPALREARVFAYRLPPRRSSRTAALPATSSRASPSSPSRSWSSMI